MVLVGLATMLFLSTGHTRCLAGGTGAISPSTFTFEITIERAASNPEAVVCQAKLTDGETGEVLFAPKVAGRLGDQGRASSAGSAHGVTLSYELTFMATQEHAGFELRVSRDGKNVLTTKGTFKI
jgi:hypothetical protein